MASTRALSSWSIVAATAITSGDSVHEVHEVFKFGAGFEFFLDALESLGPVQVRTVQQLIGLSKRAADIGGYALPLEADPV